LALPEVGGLVGRGLTRSQAEVIICVIHLVDIVKRRLIQHRRAELTTVIAEAREAYRLGNVRRGTPEDLLKELEALDE
jgi:hypothetical protein